MMVNPGLTAELDTKKLPSMTYKLSRYGPCNGHPALKFSGLYRNALFRIDALYQQPVFLAQISRAAKELIITADLF